MGYPPPPPGADAHERRHAARRDADRLDAEAARKEANPGCLFALLTLGVGPMLLRRGGG